MLEISNVVNLSVSENPVGLGAFNVNNLAYFGTDQFLSNPDGDEYRVYVSPAAVGVDFGTETEAYKQSLAVFSQQPNILAGGGRLIIFPRSGSESLSTAITRTKALIYYCGIISDFYGTNTDWAALAIVVQALGNKILFLPSATYGDVAGAFTTIKNAGNDSTRCLLYLTSSLDARLFAAAAASKGLSVNFSGSRTAITMNMKQLAGIDMDEAITQTYLTAALVAGVDVYVDYGGVPAYVSSGANKYFDEVYNLIWLVTQLQVAGFNALAQVGTKIPQTEPGMSILKGAYRKVIEQALANGYIAPGSWNSAEWFGNQDDMLANILQRGYYIYSQPVNQQSQADREARKASLIQIAINQSGAVHSTSVVVSINA